MQAYTIMKQIVERHPGARFYSERIIGMINHAQITKGHINGDKITSPLTLKRVSKNWPLSGSIILERGDGRTVTLRLSNQSPSRQWIVDVK